MGTSVRSRLVAGFTVIAVGVLATPPPTVVPAAAQARSAEVRATPRVELAASVADTVRTFAANPPNPAHFAAAGAALGRLVSAVVPPAPLLSPPPAARTRAVAPQATLNAASDGIVAAYQAIQYWVDYGVQLSSYVLQFVPFGYQISSQINIFYYDLIRPIANSVVYGLIVPVVNDPLNPASYVNGLIAVGQASVDAVVNTGIAEFNQFFGWLIPPLPPLPPRPLAAAATATAKAVASETPSPTSKPITDAPIDVAPVEAPTNPSEPAALDTSSAETAKPAEEEPGKATETTESTESTPTEATATEPMVDAAASADATVPTPPAPTSVSAADATDETVAVSTPTKKTRGTSTGSPAADTDSPAAAQHPAAKTTAKKQAHKPEKAAKPAKPAKDEHEGSAEKAKD